MRLAVGGMWIRSLKRSGMSFLRGMWTSFRGGNLVEGAVL